LPLPDMFRGAFIIRTSCWSDAESRKQKAESRRQKAEKPSDVAALSLGERVSRSGAFISRSVTGEGSLQAGEANSPPKRDIRA
jgi:hypothetical protein